MPSKLEPWSAASDNNISLSKEYSKTDQTLGKGETITSSLLSWGSEIAFAYTK